MLRQLERTHWLLALLLLSCLAGCDDTSGNSGGNSDGSARGEGSAQSPAEATQSEPVSASAPSPAQTRHQARSEPTPAASEAPLVMETSLEAQDGKWIARWSVRNRGQAAVYLVTQLPLLRSGRITPDAAHIYRRTEDETLYLTKRLWRIPKGIAPLHAELPYLVRLEPGQSSSGAIKIPASLDQSYPYRSQAGSPVLVSQVVISFGFFSDDALLVPAKGHSDLFRPCYEALETQRYVTSEPHAARLKVN